MIWLELRTNNRTYKNGWNFTESIWAPTRKANGSSWPFWSLINQITAGDIIFHLKEIGREKVFIGYSTALTNGYITQEKPTHEEHEWDFIDSYYKAELNNYQPFTNPTKLSEYFSENSKILIDIFKKNSQEKHNKKRLFYVIQNNKLQCLNGSYFSEFGQALSQLILETVATAVGNQAYQVSEPFVTAYTNTGTNYSTLAQRIGHQQFSDNVKANFKHKCCFPNCNVEGNGFLISGHIARWADNKQLRGHTSNGLCLCLMHDKAFEKGLFTLDINFTIKLIFNKKQASDWLITLLEVGENMEIKPRQINPSVEALRLHWERTGFLIN